MNPVKRFVLSTGNLAGCAAAAGVTGLFLGGVVHAGWYALASIAYAAGVAAFWRPAPQVLAAGLDTQEYLDWLRKEAIPKLPQEGASRVQSIVDLATEIWPRLKEMQEQGLVQAQNRIQLKQTLTMFLPQLVANYLKLPASYARSHKVNGKSPLDLMTEQLDLLEKHVREIRDNVYAEDVDALLSTGRFLQEKFDSAMPLG